MEKQALLPNECLKLEMHGRNFEISAAFRQAIEKLESQAIEVRRGPASLRVADIVPEIIFTAQSWPHDDSGYEGNRFVTMVVSDSTYHFGCASSHDEVLLQQGEIFEVEPLELHWLRPEPTTEDVWIALQWIVPEESLEEFRDEFRKKVEEWNEPSFKFPQLV